MELWKDYNGYKVSNTGKVMGKIGTVLAQRKHYKKGKGKRPNSYCWVVYLGNNKHNVHHLVAKCFLPPKPSDGLYCIDHIDGNKDNNHANNLRWCPWIENSLKGNLPLAVFQQQQNTTQD